jgi:hypothetical protein
MSQWPALRLGITKDGLLLMVLLPLEKVIKVPLSRNEAKRLMETLQTYFDNNPDPIGPRAA